MGVVVHGQQLNYVDFTEGNANVKLYPDSSKVEGSVTYKFDVTRSVDSIYVDARRINVDQVLLNKEPVEFFNRNNKIVIAKAFKPSLENELLISYSAKPNKALYFLKRNEDWNIWTQGQGKYTSNWLPSFDDVNEKVVFRLTYDR